MSIPLSAQHLPRMPHVPATELPDIRRLTRRLADSCRDAFMQLGPAPWRISDDEIGEGEFACTDGFTFSLRLESASGSLTVFVSLDRLSVSAAIEIAMGGTGAEGIYSLADRPLSGIETGVMKVLRDSLAKELSLGFGEHFSRPFGVFDALEGSMAEISAGALLEITFSVNVFSYSGEMRLVLQRNEFEGQLDRSESNIREETIENEKRMLQTEIDKSPLLFTVSLAPTMLPLERIRALQKGTLLELDSMITGKVILSSSGVVTYIASLTHCGDRLGVEIAGTAE